MSSSQTQADGNLEKAVYTNYYISREGIIFSENGEVTSWFVGTDRRICSSNTSRKSRAYRIELSKIKIGRNETGFYVRLEQKKQKIYGPSEKLPWM